MIQQRLEPLKIQRKRSNYPQVNKVDNKGIQWIELNRGCKRGCPFCWADPNYKTFPVPKIITNKVQIIGENILYDPNIIPKLEFLSTCRVHNKVVYFGLGNGFDYRLTTPRIAKLAKTTRIGNINNKGNWYNGINLAWDLNIGQEHRMKRVLDYFLNVGYEARRSKIFVLVNWKISLKDCLYKLIRLKEWGVKIDDCTWECTKRNFIPLYWDYPEYRGFREMCRTHNMDWRTKMMDKKKYMKELATAVFQSMTEKEQKTILKFAVKIAIVNLGYKEIQKILKESGINENKKRDL